MNKQIKSNVLIGTTVNDTFYSRLVSFFTGSKYSHSVILYRSSLWGGWWMVQVDDKGIRKIPAETGLKQYSKIRVYECALSLQYGIKTLRYYIGKKYDWFGILGFLLKILISKIVKIEILNPMHDGSKLFCSEMCMKVLQQSGVPGTDCYDANSTSPGDLHEFLEGSPYMRHVDLPVIVKK